MYKITFVKNKFSINGFESEYIKDDFLLNMIKKPLKNIEKDYLSGIMLNRLKDNNNRRVIDNVKYVTNNLLCLDIDDGVSIEEFKKSYQRYKYFLYTTSSHTPEKNKFRIFLPVAPHNFKFENEIDRKTWKRFLKKEFYFVDKQTLDISRVFYLPNKINENYLWHYNTGIIYNLPISTYNIIKTRTTKEHELEQMKTTIINHSNQATVEIAKNRPVVKDFLSEYGIRGGGNNIQNKMYKAFCSLSSINANEECYNLIIEHAQHICKYPIATINKIMLNSIKSSNNKTISPKTKSTSNVNKFEVDITQI